MSLRKRRTRRIIFVALLLGVAAAGTWLGRVAASDPLYWGTRRHWKDRAIAHIEKRFADKQWLAQESTQIAAAVKAQPSSDQWVGDEMLVMKNGQWIVCQNICSKENWRIRDIFIGRGSDGKWYYSTFHFCVRKCVLQMERWQPDSLDEFVNAYWLVPFDGHSDECLKTTWSVGPYGQAKLQQMAAR